MSEYANIDNEYIDELFIENIGRPISRFVGSDSLSLYSIDEESHFLGTRLKSFFVHIDDEAKARGLERDREIRHYELRVNENGNIKRLHPYTAKGRKVVLMDSEERPSVARLESIIRRFERKDLIDDIEDFRYVNTERPFNSPVKITDFSGLKEYKNILSDVTNES